MIEGYEWVGWLLLFVGLFALAVCISWAIDWTQKRTNPDD